MVTALLVPTVIFLFGPSNIIVPSFNDIDLCADDICKSPLLASNSNVSVFISTSWSILKCPVEPTKDTLGLETEFTYPINTPAFPYAFVDCPRLIYGLVPFASTNHCSFVPNDIEACVDDNLNPVAVMFKSVTLISTSEPVIANEVPSNDTLPSASPNLNAPSPSI